MKKVVVSALVFFSVVVLWAQNVPATLSYQGILLQNDGITPLADGPQTIVFNFYDVPTGGAAQFSRTITVTTLKGLYTCILGDGTTGNAPLPATVGNQQMYIGITVNGGAELTPRAQLTTTPYAWMAQSAYSIADNAVNSAKIADGTITDADLSAGAAITDTKLATITTAGKVANSATSATATGTANTIVARDASGNFTAGTITANVVGNVTGNISGNAATVTTNANLTGDVTSVGNATSIAAGAIVNADINNAAAIADTKLATIATAGKVANTATTATNTNTANTIVARDASGNFAAGTITANLVGNVTGNLTGNATTVTTNANLTGDVISIGNATTIATNAVTSGKILAGAVTDAKLASGIDAGKITTGTLAGSLVGTGISGANLVDGSVTSGKIQSDAATDANRAITTNHIRDGAVTNAKIGSGIDAGKITTGELLGSIVGAGINGSNLVDGSILSAKIQSDVSDDANRAITTNHIRDGAITDSKVSAITSAGKVSGSAITTGTIGGNTVINITGTINSSAITASSLSGNGSGLTSLNAANISSGTLPVTRGGTGATTITGAIIGNGSGAFTGLTASGASQYLRRNSGNTAYEFGTLSIVNSDIAAGANIADSKLATISTAGKVSGNAITSGVIGGSTSLSTSGTLSLTSAASDLIVGGFTRLGTSVLSPLIKTVKITGTTCLFDGCAVSISIPNTLGGTVSDIDKVLLVSVFIQGLDGNWVAPVYTNATNVSFNYYLNPTTNQLVIRLRDGQSSELVNRQYRAFVVFEE